MKKVVAILLLFACMIPISALADIDLSDMSFDELVELKEKIDLAMWQSEEWKKVIVPQELWIIGINIPAGHWTIKAQDGERIKIQYGESVYNRVQWEISEYVFSPTYEFYKEEYGPTQIDIEMEDGHYLKVDLGSAVFYPYYGKPSFEFSNDEDIEPTQSPTNTLIPPEIYEEFDYKAVARKPESYVGNRYTITGKVIQVLKKNDQYTFRVSTGEYSSDIIMLYARIDNMPDYRILEDDKIVAKCIFEGEYTYDSILGKQITVPLAQIESIELKDN